MHIASSDLQEEDEVPLDLPFKEKENCRANTTKMIANTQPEASTSKRSVRFGISRSQEEESKPTLLEVETPTHYGRISPLLSTNLRSYGAGMADVAGATANTIPRATNLRLKFRKSHTCGSLFANCNCSSPPAMPPPIHTTGSGSSSNSTSQNLNAQRSSYATAPCMFNFSISPTNADLSSHSASTQHTSSGFYSLSTQTSSATSAQLSRDESMNVSFDWCGGGQGEGRSNSLDSGVSASGGQSATLPHRKHSPVSFRLASVTENEHARVEQTRNATAKSLQVPGTATITDAAVVAPVVSAAISPTTTRKNERKAKRFFQSYSHPDTDYIFTDANKKPSRESLIQIHVQHQQEPVIKTRDGKLEFKQPKRSSSPNIGQYQVLDVAVHPDILVKISPKHSPVPGSHYQTQSPQSTPRSAQQRRRLLQRSHEIDSGGSTSESEKNFESPPVGNAAHLKLQFGKENNIQTTEKLASPIKSRALVEDASFDAAQKYFAESGILGPINTASPLIRKTSKILQDANVHEQIRKTSMILRANGGINSSNNTNSNTSPTTTATATPKLQPPSSPKSKALVLAPSLSVLPVEKPKIHTIDENSYSKQNNCNTQYNVYSMERPTPLAYAHSNNSTSSSKNTNGLSTPQSPHTMATTCGFSPNVTTKSCNVTDDRDAQIKSMQGEIVSLKDVIKARDAEIAKLRREIHKLKSVLQQTANPLPIAIADLPPSPTTLAPSPNNFLLASSNQICTVCKKNFEVDDSSNPRMGQLAPENSNSVESNSSDATNAGNTTVTCALANNANNGINNQPVEIALDAAAAQTANEAAAAALTSNGFKAKLLPMATHQQTPVLKKQGVSGESCETSMQQSFNIPIPKFEKDFSSKQLIKDAIMDNDFLKNIDASQVRELVESMYPLSIAKGEFVVREGEVGAHLYVSAEGEFEVVKGGVVLSIMGPGKAFGELAILYNCTRTASIRVLSDARVWVLDRRVFQQIMMRTGIQRIENSVNFLKSVPLLKNLSMEVLAQIADVLEVVSFRSIKICTGLLE
uniref:cGMP-dependent protein kinase, isozyme 1 n=1 Tax=Bactrocera latifrons TaxID=174628 RepID=A0A0K8UPR2_BACLA